MSGPTRLAILAALLLTIYAAGQYGMNYWTTWTPDTKASVWVAVGTLLLAVATFWSVWETRLVIRGEDRRHQQSFAPSLRIDSSETQAKGVCCLTNRGGGLASRLRLKADLTLYFLMLANQSSEARSCDREVSQVAVGEKVFVNLLAGQSTPDKLQAVAIHQAELVYEDMFGNEYRTIYEDWNKNEYRFEWKQPSSLAAAKTV